MGTLQKRKYEYVLLETFGTRFNSVDSLYRPGKHLNLWVAIVKVVTSLCPVSIRMSASRIPPSNNVMEVSDSPLLFLRASNNKIRLLLLSLVYPRRPPRRNSQLL
jgi:hypothetical protein